MDLVIFTIQLLASLIVQGVGIVLGLFIVPVMLLFGRFDESTKKPFSMQNKGRYWTREVFPKVFWAWDNKEDSSVGDVRGWWDDNCFGADAYRPINRFWWMAIRNPFNNFKRLVLGIDIRKYTMSKILGQDYVRDDLQSTGFQLLKATPNAGGIPRYMLYYVRKWEGTDRAIVIQLGNKIKLSHNTTEEMKEIDNWKGFTFEVNPYKDIS